MTREEALTQLRLGHGINEDVSEEYNDAVNLAIKALEQEPVLDTDIILSSEEYGELVSNEYDNGYAKGYRDALENEESVIDKIRAEIETKYGQCNLCEYSALVYTAVGDIADILQIIDKYKTESEGSNEN
jgi:hypothetical protein